MIKIASSFFSLLVFAFALSSNHAAWSQVLDPCDCCPAHSHSALSHASRHYESAIHGYPPGHSITTDQLISDQNQYLEQQFKQIADHREAMSLRMSALENRNSKAMDQLNKSVADLATGQQKSFNKLAQVLRDRDQKIVQELRRSDQRIVKELKANDEQIAEQLEQGFASIGKLTRDLVTVAKKSSETTKSVVDVIGKTEGRYSSIQNQIRENSALISRSMKLLSREAEMNEVDRKVSHELFEALDKDLEAIRHRISRIEKAGAGQHKKLLEKLNLLNELEEKLDKLTKKNAPKRKKKKK